MQEEPDRDNNPKQPERRPKSVTSMTINWLGFGVTAWVWLWCMNNGVSLFRIAVATIAVFILVVVMLETLFLRTPYRSSTGIDWSLWRSPDYSRVAIKTLGFYVTLGLIALAYWVISQYHNAFFANFRKAIEIFVPCLLLAQIPYFLLVDRFMREPEDAYFVIGRFVLGWRENVDSLIVKQHFLGWLVKAFFLPLMFADYINLLGATRFSAVGFIQFFDWAYNAIFTVDLLLVTVGYVFTLKLFDSHIRSTEPTMLGWVVAIICYPPFWGSIYSNVLPYDPAVSWGAWIRNGDIDPVTVFGIAMGTNWQTICWGSGILICGLVYVWASLAFGLRFSNLTNRGILTNGPYRFTKHPAYVFKNISWWMIAVPFVAHAGIENAVRECLMLLTVNFIYFMRARTEERHLSHDPAYVEYALYMNRRSIFAPVAVLLPFLRYRRPRLIPGFALKL